MTKKLILDKSNIISKNELVFIYYAYERFKLLKFFPPYWHLNFAYFPKSTPKSLYFLVSIYNLLGCLFCLDNDWGDRERGRSKEGQN